MEKSCRRTARAGIKPTSPKNKPNNPAMHTTFKRIQYHRSL